MTFVRRVAPGSIHEWCTLDWPARWTMRSGRAVATAAVTAGRVVEVGLEHGGSARARAGRPAARTHEREHLHLGMVGAQQLQQVAAHEAVSAGDEDPHRLTSAPAVVALVVLAEGGVRSP